MSYMIIVLMSHLANSALRIGASMYPTNRVLVEEAGT